MSVVFNQLTIQYNKQVCVLFTSSLFRGGCAVLVAQRLFRIRATTTNKLVHTYHFPL